MCNATPDEKGPACERPSTSDAGAGDPETIERRWIEGTYGTSTSSRKLCVWASVRIAQIV
jgi:hypothetical protein